MLSVFPASFDRGAAAAVWAADETAARDDLSALVQRSLLLFDPESSRYRWHDLMRLVAQNAFGYGGGPRDEAAEQQRLKEASARHAEHYMAVLAAANALYLKGGEGVLQGLALFDLERANIEAGQAWAAGRADRDDAAARLCSSYPNAGAYVLDLRQHPRDRIRWLEAALAAARRLKDRRAEGVHLGNLGRAYGGLGPDPPRDRVPRTSFGHRPRDRRPPGRRHCPGQPGQRLPELGRDPPRHRVLRAGSRHRP